MRIEYEYAPHLSEIVENLGNEPEVVLIKASSPGKTEAGIGYYVTKENQVKEKCKNSKLPDEPDNYVGWHRWANKKSKTHKQKQCKKCGYWHIWETKK